MRHRAVQTAWRGVAAAATATAIALALAAPPRAAATEEAWAALEGVRQALAEGGPLTAVFTQTYLPAGFDSGEQEGGRLALALPDCLRWDYADPYPKSFLLCGNQVYSWNPGDKTGRRDLIDSQSEPGLDLLLLSVERLKERYEAALATLDDGVLAVRLTPTSAAAPFRDAELEVDATTHRPRLLAYEDQDGNRTRFELSEFRPLAEPELFAPPELDWQEP